MRLLFLFTTTVFRMAVATSPVQPGVEVFFAEQHDRLLKTKKIGLIVNHTSVDRRLCHTIRLFTETPHLRVCALFSPEHGLNGQFYAAEAVESGKWGNIAVHSLHGATRRPTSEMLEGIDTLIYDIQCIGSRSYTYPSTLFYAMEEAAQRGIEVIVLDRPNPINGEVIDGPCLEEKWRSFIGYINVPYCHGMTIGELAQFFNEEYKIGCKLKVIPMKGWTRNMSYRDTGLVWVPPSPNIPEEDTPFFYPATGILGELKILNIGIGYTLPFKIAGAPWIDAEQYATALNAQKLPGVHFVPYSFKPFYGLYKGKSCHGVLIRVLDPLQFRPLAVQYLLLGILKSLYPKELMRCLEKNFDKGFFHRANGTDAIFKILLQKPYPAWELIGYQQKERDLFKAKRKQYLFPQYAQKFSQP